MGNAGEMIVQPIQSDEYRVLSDMVGELLNEIMDKIHVQAFHFNQAETEARAKDLVSRGKYWVFMAKEAVSGELVGFVSLYESYALYAEGAYGTMPELYVRPQWRSRNIGEAMLMEVKKFAASKAWKRLEVTTPPLPEFDRTLKFYQFHGFEIAGGRKLKLDIGV
ncbi:ribosomal protein S18 acetylase RimI-like enzyme [Sulfurirhabdus autotrophica]|uniref:Ribosomal protein S18 acetylase RimI-like enzyme n=2 Tax=Sulfurirhabdus autotrophica TaxID=1706046 RepID=A0A4R3YF22_9PROT|nr:ribosomal protein S18 acetylase RimI-like enzyme [Sulfurirhabdus autotrophica]